MMALMRKNCLLLWSHKIQLIIVLLLPSMGMAFSYGMQRWVSSLVDYDDWYGYGDGDDRNPERIVSQTLPIRPCGWYDVYRVQATRDCATILFAPHDAADAERTNEIMRYLADEAGLPFVPVAEAQADGDGDDDEDDLASWRGWTDGAVVGLPSAERMGQFLAAHPGRAESIVYFQTPVSVQEGSRPLVSFRFNASSHGDSYYSWYYDSFNNPQNDELIPLALRRAFMAVNQDKDEVFVRIRKRDMFDEESRPKVDALSDEQEESIREEEKKIKRELSADLISWMYGPVFMFAVVIVSAILANQAANEKSGGLIGALRVVGMADSAYWSSWFAVSSLAVILPGHILAMILAYAANVALLTDAGFWPPFLAMMATSCAIYAAMLWAVSLSNNRPLLYGLTFILLVLTVVAVTLPNLLNAAPKDTAGKVFQYAIPGYNFGSVMYSIHKFNGRAGYDANAMANFTRYGMSEFFERLGRCNSTILRENNTCVMEDLYDDWNCDWDLTDCREYDDGYYPCAPDDCYFRPLSDATKVLVMIVQTMFLLLLAWYTLQVIPSGNGLSYRPWFVFEPKYWCPGRRRGGRDDEAGGEAQRLSSETQGIVVRGITKTFHSNTAVNHVDMDIRNGQVFVLLGHNGAGKTTLINMLTGKLSPTSGEAYVLGMSVRDNVHAVQRLVGSVPQHDLLWNELSAYEHIRMFARIKGLGRRKGGGGGEGDDLERAVRDVLRKVHLTDAGRQQAGGYSGGMKRRLSIALAGIGGPKVIFMDEPTTGIDPLNRRRIWNLVRELKRDRVVVLTTHLMQEADCLGDHIAILDNGVVQAEGTPLNLKTTHGTGYTLNMVADMENVSRVENLTKSAIPSVVLVNRGAGSLSYGVPQEHLPVIPSLTRQLQEDELIREWGISQSTLEEVFLRLASQSTNLQNRRREMRGRSSSSARIANGVPDDGTVNMAEDDEAAAAAATAAMDGAETAANADQDDVFAPPGSLWRLQLWALLRKTFILRKRHWIATLVQLAIPICMIALTKAYLFQDPEVGRGDVLDWPQATTGNPDRHSRRAECNFTWLLLSELYPDPIDTWKKPEVAAIDVRFPTVDRYGSGAHHATFSFRVSNLSNGASAERVGEALAEAMAHYLTRTTSSDDQVEVDRQCKLADGVVCGPCRMDNITWEVLDEGDGFVEFGLARDDPGNMEECAISEGPTCGTNEVRFMLTRDLVVSRASDSLGGTIAIDGPFRFYGNPVDDLTIGSLVRTPSIQTSDDEECSLCFESGSVWLNGPNAELFGSALAQLSGNESVMETRVVTDDVTTTIQQNRRALLDDAVPFGPAGANGVDTSECSTLGRPEAYKDDFASGEVYYGMDYSNARGMISNLGNLSAVDTQSDNIFPRRENFCRSTFHPMLKYRELFPDAGITLSKFSVEERSLRLDVTYLLDVTLLDEGRYWSRFDGDEGLFTPQQQSVYSLYCSPDEADEDGACADSSSLQCARVVASRGCDGRGMYVDGRSLVDLTYTAIAVGVGGEGALPIIEEAESSGSPDYQQAVSIDEIALFSFMIAVSIALISPNVASVVVMEKNQRFVFALLLNGLKIPVYWVSLYLVHMITAALLSGVFLIIGSAVRLSVFASQQPHIGWLILTILVYIHAQFGFVVLLSSFFKRERFAAVLIGFLVFILLGIAVLIDLGGTNSSKREWKAAMSLVPMFGVLRCLVLVFWKRYYAELIGHIGVMLVSSTLYLILGIYWQSATGVGAVYRLDCGLSWKNVKDSSQTVASGEDDNDDSENSLAEADIAREAQRALALDPVEAAIKVVHLGKTFPGPKHAVVDVTMAMDYGEIFGLLGPNGAGKTTVISMLVGQLSPSHGQAFVAGYDSVLDRRLALTKLGIVPQFDVYYPELTVEEHLMMYAGMKGVKGRRQSSWARSIASLVGLGSDDFFHRQAQKLSGGMRRRLSIAVALLSSPRVLFLDEPTTGLDPEMKRSIWTIVERMKQDRCVILTTHAMDEAEALCNRIGIMARGSLKCVGTQQELRERYGSTYELTFTVPRDTRKDDKSLEDFLSKSCPSTKVVSNYGETRVFTVDKDDMDLSNLFELILRGRETGLYFEWGINNTSLDEVFVAITAESEGVEAGEI